MTIKIDSKITAYEVVNRDAEQKAPESNVVHMHEQIGRPEMLLGSTYKIKTPLTEHALYVTINDIVLNEGTAHKKRRYTPSIVAELGDVIECHLKMIGLIKTDEPDVRQQKYLAEKRAQHETRSLDKAMSRDEQGSFPSDAQRCVKCSTKGVIKR